MKAKLLLVPPATIDTFGDLLKLRDEFAPTERLYQKCFAELKALAATGDPAAEYIVKGERYTLRISPCSMERKPDVFKARKMLGAAAFMEVVSITLKALGQFLAQPEIDALAVTTQTGSRSYAPTAIAHDAGASG